MKFPVLLSISLALLVGFTSCNKDDDPEPGLTTVNVGPTANFQASVISNSYAPAIVEFSNVSSNALSYTWNFGDGSPESNEATSRVKHTYQEGGTYSVKLTAHGQNGTIGVKVMDVVIASVPPQLAAITAKPYLLTTAIAQVQGQTVNIMQFMPPCSLDDLTHFKISGMFEIQDAGTQCSPTTAQNGQWMFQNNFSRISIYSAGFTQELEVVSLTPQTLVLQQQDGSGSVFTYTYTPQ